MTGRRLQVLALALGAIGLLGIDRPDGLGDVVDVRHWSYPDYTRIVIELDRPVSTEVVRLPPDPNAKRPERLYLDLDGVWVGRDYPEGVPVEDGLLQSVRLGQNTLRRTRVVLDLERYDRHRLLELSHPDRIGVDLYGRRDGEKTQEAGSDRSEALPPELRPVRTVVIDAGHGGRDPGAIGIGGLREKDVTLKVAKALGDELEDEGFDVVYTRTRDKTLTLEERTVRAESAGGDLFISVHANAAPRRSVEGVETFYLDENYERHSLNLAARENGIPRGEVNVLQRTLARLHMEEVSPHSELLATKIQSQVVTGLPRRLRPKNLGVKKGPFYVLFLSNMPAVLVEVGFLTNKAEAKRLRDDDYLEAMASQIAAGIVGYRGERKVRLARTKESQ
jgi:N-acetylmuramoyl-L-alanine amidase